MKPIDFPDLIDTPITIAPVSDKTPVSGGLVTGPVLMQAALGAVAHAVNRNGHPLVKAASAFAIVAGSALLGVGLRSGSMKIRDAGGYLFSAGMIANGLDATRGLKFDVQTAFGTGVTATALKYGSMVHAHRGKATSTVCITDSLELSPE